VPKKDVVALRDDQRELLYALIHKSHTPARTERQAHTLLLANEPQPTPTIALL
jgi:hypothetical protein